MFGWNEESKEARKNEKGREKEGRGKERKEGRKEERTIALCTVDCNLTAASPVSLRSKFCVQFFGIVL